MSQESKLTINWSEIITKSVTTLITAIVMGAAYIVYQGATTVETKIQAAKETLQNQNLVITQLVQAIDHKLSEYREADELKFAALEKTLKEVMRDNQLSNTDGLSKISGITKEVDKTVNSNRLPASNSTGRVESIIEQIPQFSEVNKAASE